MKQRPTRPFFSVIVPTLNEAKHLPGLLTDLAEQTFNDFEVIIVDALSEDETVKKAKTFSKKYKKLTILTSGKKNVSHQRNLGAKKSKADWIIFMDADNRIPKYFLSGLKFHSEMLNPDILSTWIEPDGKSHQDKATAIIMNIFMDLNKSTPNPYVLESMLLVKRKSFQILGGFDISVHWAEGSDLLRRAWRKKMKFEFVKIPKYTYSFRRLRKEGAYKLLQNDVQMELSRIVYHKLSKNKAGLFYPMEGGNLYQVNHKERPRVKKLVLHILRGLISSS